MSAAIWSAPYCGVQHLGGFTTARTWATVQDYGSFALSLIWTPGCGFSPAEDQHANASEARAFAERRVAEFNGGRA